VRVYTLCHISRDRERSLDTPRSLPTYEICVQHVHNVNTAHLHKVTRQTLITVCTVLRTHAGNRDGSVGIAAGWTARVRFSAGQGSSLLHSVQIGSGAHPLSHPVGTGSKAAGA
jgi:hypothetical protein